MSRRTTVKVADVIRAANEYLALEDFPPEFRRGISAMAEMVLFSSDQYRGFGYIGGYDPDGDDTRRRYFMKG